MALRRLTNEQPCVSCGQWTIFHIDGAPKCRECYLTEKRRNTEFEGNIGEVILRVVLGIIVIAVAAFIGYCVTHPS